MHAIKEFEASLDHLSSSTKRAYLAGAKAVLSAAFADSEPCGDASYAEWWAWARKVGPLKSARVQPFLRFLESRQAPTPPESLDLVCREVLAAVDRANRLKKNPSVTSRRDAALVAALCAAPTQGNPRTWPIGSLGLQEARVLLWETEVEDPVLRRALHYWHHWRERLSRPDQRRLYRKSLKWSQSELLFPGPGGRVLARTALHNALRRLQEVGEGRVTPEKVRVAFLAGSERFSDGTV